MVSEKRAWWLDPSGFVGLAAALTLWSLFWWALVDQRVVDVDWWWRLLAWVVGVAALALATRRSPVHWYDPFDSWGGRAGERHPFRGRAKDRVKRGLVVVSVLAGVIGPWLLTNLTESLGVHFALNVHDDVRHSADPEQRHSVTRLLQAARDRGGAASIERVAPDGSAHVTVWDRPAPGAPSPDQPAPPNTGNAACVVLPGRGLAKITSGPCA